jgi:hypothetical protein
MHMILQVQIVDPIIQTNFQRQQDAAAPSTSQIHQDLLTVQPNEQANTAEEMSTPPPLTDPTPEHVRRSPPIVTSSNIY